MYTPEIKFCVKYLLDNGVNSITFIDVVNELSSKDKKFEFVEIKPVSDMNAFFNELAEKLREMWPPGEKDGRWPWRDSVSNLSRRLQHLWKIREMKDYTIDECLAAARKYLSQFEDNTKYMQVLKYFIFKQKAIVEKDGTEKFINESRLADLLESKSDFDKIDEEWNDILNGDTIDQGELI